MDENKTFIDRQPIILQILILLGLSGLMVITFSGLAMALIKPLFGVVGADTLLIKIQTDPDSIKGNMNEINAFKFIQLLSTPIGLFLAPALLFGIMKKFGQDYLKFAKPFKPVFIILSILVLLSSGPIVNLLQEWNQAMKLPGFLSGVEKWMRDSEDANAKATQLLLIMPHFSDFIFNFLLIGVMTAIGEEAFFRGVLQQLFREWFKNAHVAIWVGAIVFSALHFEFYGFLPRMVLGALLGYLYYWSGNLWVSIIGHLVNNGSQVVLLYLYQRGLISYNIDSNEAVPVYITIIATILLAGFLYMSYKNRKPEPVVVNEVASINSPSDTTPWQ